MATYQHDEFLFRSFSVLILILGVAFVAYALRNRTLFIAGTLGSLTGFGSEGSGRKINGSGDAIYMARLHFAASDAFWGGLIAAVAFGLLVLLFQFVLLPLLKYGLRRFSGRVSEGAEIDNAAGSH